MIDVHEPHEAVHTWKDFFIHIATIVVGLVIAIGLEQSVEAIHHHRQIVETRTALRVEREQNMRSYAASIQEFHRQTAALVNNLIVLRYLEQHPGTPQQLLPGVLVWHAIPDNFTESAWKTAQQSSVTALMPQEEVRRDALLYERIEAAAKGFDLLWPAIVQARLYAVLDPDPSHLTPAQVAREIDLTQAVIVAQFIHGAALVQLSYTDPGFQPRLSRNELNSLMHIAEPEHNPALANAIALTNSRLPASSAITMPPPSTNTETPRQ